MAGSRTSCVADLKPDEVVVKSVTDFQNCSYAQVYGTGRMLTIETVDSRTVLAGCTGFGSAPTGYTWMQQLPNYGRCSPGTDVIWYLNAPPASRGFHVATPVDTVYSGAISTSDPNGDKLAYTAPAFSSGGGTVVLDANTGGYTFTPRLYFQGTDYIDITAKDGKGGEASITVIIDVGQISSTNRPPVFPVFKIVADQGQAGFQFIAYDPENDPITFTLDQSQMPVHGTITSIPGGTNTYRYTAEKGYAGFDKFAAFATDNHGNKTRTEFTILPRNYIENSLTQILPLILED